MGPTWLKVKFDLKLSNQMEKKMKKKMKWKWMGRQIKNDVKCGNYEWNWIQTWGPILIWKQVSQKYFTNMFLIFLRHNGMADVKLTKENHNTRWELRSSGPLRVAANQTIDIFIRGCYLQYPDFLSQGMCFWLGLKSVISSQAWAHQSASV